MAAASAKSIDEIVRQSQVLSPQDRLPFILQACGTDSVLHAEVLDRLVTASATKGTDEISHVEVSTAAGWVDTRRRFGPYRVIRSLGQGGMGEVFLAERDDDQYRQRVAIKLGKHGVESDTTLSRLRQERQILASLDHPNIARLFDGGTTPEGMPYIVMEYVDGEPIDRYCDRLQLPVSARLKLFMLVCGAVHRAHQSLIVHRDLKPSNILVTKEGVPKLLDFGIAKWLDTRERMHALAMTQADVRVMTPDHASPEQIQGDVITTASDIYVLGVLLYELLSGCKPVDIESTRLSDLEREICERDPKPPSVAFAALLGRDSVRAAAIARRCGVSTARLQRELSGDLDNIVLMAMRKEPHKRYSSAENLAADLRRYLERLPVAARPQSWTYRSYKFVRRHGVSVVLSAAFLLSLTAFSANTYVQSQHVRHERDAADTARERAQSERQRAEAVAAFLIDSFKVADPVRARGKDVTAREILDSGAKRVTKELVGEPALQATLLDTIGNVYLNLGLPNDARPLIERGLKVRRELYGSESLDVAESLRSLDKVLVALGDFRQVASLAQQSLAINRRLSGDHSLPTAASWCQLGAALYNRLELTDAEAAFRTCLAIRESKLGRDGELTAAPLDGLALIALMRRDYPTTERLYREAIAIDARVHGVDHPRHILHVFNLASVLRDEGRLGEARPLYETAIELSQKVLGLDHPDTIDGMLNLGQLLLDQGELDDAERIFNDVLVKDRRVAGPVSDRVGYDLTRLGRVAFARSDFNAAAQRYRDALAVYQRTLPKGHPYIGAANLMLGRTYLALNEATKADRVLSAAAEVLKSNFGAHSTLYAFAEGALGQARLLQGRRTEGARALRNSYPLLAASQSGADDREMARQLKEWIESFYRSQQRPEAAAEYFAKIAGADK